MLPAGTPTRAIAKGTTNRRRAWLQTVTPGISLWVKRYREKTAAGPFRNYGYGYVVSRLLHFAAYVTAHSQEMRATFWTIGSLILIYMSVRVLYVATA